MKIALLLMAHGSRHEDANADLRALAEELRRRGEYAIVEASFLELAEPDIEAAARTCVAQGADRVVMVPYFLSAGVHVRRDLQGLRDRLAGEFREVEFLLAEPLGRHELLLELVTLRANQAQRASGP